MKIYDWFYSIVELIRPSKTHEDIEIATKLAVFADVFLLPLGAADLDGPRWALKESNFMAGYLQGVGDILAQASGRERGSMLGPNLALHFAKRLFAAANAPNEVFTAYVHLSMLATGPQFEMGMTFGSRDANAFISTKKRGLTFYPIALSEHFGSN